MGSDRPDVNIASGRDGCAAPSRVLAARSRVDGLVPAPAPPETDGELLHACRDGNELAWDRLVGRYERLVFSVALRNGLNRDDAADVTQQTFLDLLQSIDSLRDDERLASWLMTVARRQSWKLMSREARERRPLELEKPAEDLIAVWERAAMLQAGLGKLGRGCRELLQALYFGADSGSYADVAARLGRQVGSIGPMRARCLRQLRTILGEDSTW